MRYIEVPGEIDRNNQLILYESLISNNEIEEIIAKYEREVDEKARETESSYPDGKFYGACAEAEIVIDNGGIDSTP